MTKMLVYHFAVFAAAAAAPALPKFSWDTIPVFYHSCNYTGAFTDVALQTIAKFPLVVSPHFETCFVPSRSRTSFLLPASIAWTCETELTIPVSLALW